MNVKHGILSLVAMTVMAGSVVASVRDACNQDIKTYCEGVQRGKGRIRQCLKDHETQISAGCKTAMDEAKAACEPDRQKFCADVPEGNGQIMECLRSHRRELSQACQDAAK